MSEYLKVPKVIHYHKEWHDTMSDNERYLERQKLNRIKSYIPSTWTYLKTMELCTLIDKYENYAYYNSDSKMQYYDSIKEKMYHLQIAMDQAAFNKRLEAVWNSL